MTTEMQRNAHREFAKSQGWGNGGGILYQDQDPYDASGNPLREGIAYHRSTVFWWNPTEYHEVLVTPELKGLLESVGFPRI